MSAESSRAVFLSYASQDADAARNICAALRAGVEVWFDQNQLVGGDAWDHKIRGQIASCALFVPIISANTQARGEGYFRLEWKLAVDRSHLMAHDQAFVLCHRDAPEAEALVDRAQALAPTSDGYAWKLTFLMQLRGDVEAAKAYVEIIPPQLLLEDRVAAYVARLWLWAGDGEKALAAVRRVPRDFFEEGSRFGFSPKNYLSGRALELMARTTAAQAEWRPAVVVVEKRISADPDRNSHLTWRALLLALVESMTTFRRVDS